MSGTGNPMYGKSVASFMSNKKYNEWCTNPVFDDETKQELLMISGDDSEIQDRF